MEQPRAPRTEVVDQIQDVHDLFCDPFHDSVQYSHVVSSFPGLSAVCASGKERGNVCHNKTKAVQNRPGNDDPLQPGTALIHGLAGFREIHQKQRHGCGHYGGNGGYEDDLVVDILHDLIGLVPHIGSKHRLDIRCDKRKEQEGCVEVFPVADRPLFLR